MLKSASQGLSNTTGVGFEELGDRLDEYIEWYRGGKSKRSLGWRTIEEYRRDLDYGDTLAT